MPTKFFLSISIFLLSFIFNNCSIDKTDTPLSETDILFNEIKNSSFSNYQGVDSILTPNGPSPHGPFKLRFNITAQSALDSTGKLPEGAAFPEGSIVLKEVYNAGTISYYVAIKKSSKHENAAGNWLWYGFYNDGSIKYNPADKGINCINCHSIADNRDHTLSFVYH